MSKLEEHLISRQKFEWGTYGKDGKQPFKRVKLSKLSNDHIQAILVTQPHINKGVVALLSFELGYRGGIGLWIGD